MKKQIMGIWLFFAFLESAKAQMNILNNQNCSYPMQMANSMAEEDDGSQEEIKELREQLKEKKNEKKERKKEFELAQKELKKVEAQLKQNLEPGFFQFYKNYAESESRCDDYLVSAASVENSKEAPKENRKVLSPALKKLWPIICDSHINARGKLEGKVCRFAVLIKTRTTDCEMAVNGFPDLLQTTKKSKQELDEFEGQIAEINESIKELSKKKDKKSNSQSTQMLAGLAAMQGAGVNSSGNLNGNNNSYGNNSAAMINRNSMSQTEGQLCLACLNRGGSFSGATNSLFGSTQTDSFLNQSVMALLTYGGTSQAYDNVISKNSSLGYATAMPQVNPIMAASPFILGAMTSGMGSGSFGCAGNNSQNGFSGGSNMRIGGIPSGSFSLFGQ